MNKFSNKLNIAIVNVLNKRKKYAMNKDLNGGFGTADDYGGSIFSSMIRLVKKKSVKLPIVGLATLQAIFKEQGHKVRYFEGRLPKNEFDLILIYGTIVDYRNENRICEMLKGEFPEAKVGFIGPFPSVMPELFSSGDFVVVGEAESFFIDEFEDIYQMKGRVEVNSSTDIDKFPSPNFDGFPIEEYSYSPAISKKPFLALQASKGCPYSCSHYCVYGEGQGSKVRCRSPEKVVDDIIYIQKRYGVLGVQFRDPTFGVVKGFIDGFCRELNDKRVEVEWGIETRLDLISEENILQMYKVGLRNINIGIETNDVEIAKSNRRKLVEIEHQERIIEFCKKLGVKLSAFYILAYEGDTRKSIHKMVDYAIKLNTFLARFAVATPYPGTGFYEQLSGEDRVVERDLEKYTQFNLVHKHKNLSQMGVKNLLNLALRRYYFRPSYFLMVIKWKIREFWS